MLYQVIDLFRDRFLRTAKLLVDSDLERTIRWIHVAELSGTIDTLVNEVKSGDLLIVLGKNNSYTCQPGMIQNIIKICVEYDLAAVVFYQGAIPEKERNELIRYVKARRFPVLEIQGENPPISSLTSTIMRGITEKNHTTPGLLAQGLAMDILHNDCGSPELFIAYASSAGYDLRSPLQAMIIETIYRKKIRGKKEQVDLMEKYQEFTTVHVPAYVNITLSRYFRIPYLSAVVDNKYFVFLPENREKSIKKIGEEILEILHKKSDNCFGGIRIAIGMPGKSLEEFYQSACQAGQQCHLSRLSK